MAARNRPLRFSPKWIEALTPADKVRDYVERATPGLCLRVTPKGAKSFRWRARSLGRLVTIGPWAMDETPGHVTLKQARDWVDLLRAARRGGPEELARVEAQLRATIQPKPSPAPGAEGVTVAAVAENFLKLLDGTRKRPEEARYIVNKDIVPTIGRIPLLALKKSDCRALIERVTERGAKVHAGKVLGLLKQMLDYAENVEDDFVNPAARLKAANLGIESNVRDRWLSEEEIPLLWSVLEHAEPRTRLALRLLLLTAVRTQELRLARWEDFDLKAATWTIPVANQKLTLKQAKKAKPFTIPLTSSALALFEELRALAGESPFVLASPEASEGRYSERALSKAMHRLWPHPQGKWEGRPELRGVPAVRPHDLRRTARTWLGKLGILPHICERCLNHSIGRIAKVYDQGDYFEERRATLDKWDAFLRRLTAPEQSNVAFLPAVGT